MNTANAIGFFLLGTVMQVLPWMNGAGYDPSSSQTLWLHFMGAVTGLVGGSYLLNQAWRETSAYVAQLAARRLEARERLAQARPREVPLGGVRVTF